LDQNRFTCSVNREKQVSYRTIDQSVRKQLHTVGKKLKRGVRDCLDRFTEASPELLQYVGLSGA